VTQLSLTPSSDPAALLRAGADYGVWTDHQVPSDPAAWDPTVRRFYEYWLSVAPHGRLPGRQHIAPEDIITLLPRLWMCDVFRDPLRFRYRLVGTEIVRSVQRELTGQWLDEAQPQSVTNPTLSNRYRFIVETGRPTWRRGPTLWSRDPHHRTVENCLVPLATDGETVDKIFAMTALFDADGRQM
jgi:hypothetical protein